MKLIEFIKAANEGYPDGFLLEYCDPRTGHYRDNDLGGDMLAAFIVAEIGDAYMGMDNASTEEQLHEILKCLTNAMNEIQSVMDALNNL